MNPETITFTKLFSNFTPKHWVKFISSVSAVVSILCAGGFWVGKTITESKLAEQITQLHGKLNAAQNKLDIAENNLMQANKRLGDWAAAYNGIRSSNEESQLTIAGLSKQLNSVNNCSFIQKQILDFQNQLYFLNQRSVRNAFGSSTITEEEAKVRIASVQKIIESYQVQLAHCAK
jgi:chromosome segregation ATPase